MNKLILGAPAKINIGLNIVSKRDDGFHNLETFFYPIYDLKDELKFEHNNNFIFDSNNSLLNKDPDNLIIKSHTLIEKMIDRKLPLKITLNKNIPIGAGMGGGSSDAAATLVGLNEFFNLNIRVEKLYEISLELGSDVPFFIRSKPAVGKSRGELLEFTDSLINHPILIINPGIHISTKDAFSNIHPNPSSFDYNYFLEKKKFDFKYLSNNMVNDFEEYIFDRYSEIKEIKDIMIDSGSLFSMMSGTGSTIYGIFESWKEANEASEKLPRTYFKFISK